MIVNLINIHFECCKNLGFRHLIIKVWSTFLKINVNYDFKTNKYTFNLTGKRAGTATYKLVYFTGDKTTKTITATINVDSQGMLQNPA